MLHPSQTVVLEVVAVEVTEEAAEAVVASKIVADVEVVVVVDVEVAVVDSVIVDVEVLVVVVAQARTEVALETSKARSRLSKSKMLAAAPMLLRKCLVDLWVDGFVGCGLLTILLPRSCGH